MMNPRDQSHQGVCVKVLKADSSRAQALFVLVDVLIGNLLHAGVLWESGVSCVFLARLPAHLRPGPWITVC